MSLNDGNVQDFDMASFNGNSLKNICSERPENYRFWKLKWNNVLMKFGIGLLMLFMTIGKSKAYFLSSTATLLNKRLVLQQNQSFDKFPIGGVPIVCHFASPLVRMTLS